MMYGEHRGIDWDEDRSDGYVCAQVADTGGWSIVTPSRRCAGQAQADAVRACDWLADLRDGIDLRAELAAVTAERDRLASRERGPCEQVAFKSETLRFFWFDEPPDALVALEVELEAARAELAAVTAERDAARAALTAAGLRARVGRVVLGALDRLRGGGE